MTDILFSTFAGGGDDEVRLQLRESRKKLFLDLRVYASVVPDQEKVATGKGLSIGVEHFQEFKKAVLGAEALLREKGCLE